MANLTPLRVEKENLSVRLMKNERVVDHDRSYSYGMIFLVIHIKSGNNSLPMEGEWNGGHAFT